MQKSVACAADAQIAKLAINIHTDLAGLSAKRFSAGMGISGSNSPPTF
jgi:hypothetical protein